MKNRVHLVMPMGGAGSRFFKDGYVVPKPLIKINDKPFLYWATQSVLKYVDVEDLIFIVLQEHVTNFQIDKVIKSYFENAKIVIIPKILNGAVLTCLEGVKTIIDDNPIIINDCDHIFGCKDFFDFCNNGKFDNIDGALLTFTSNDPKFSFLELGSNGNVINTVEKVAISDKAICGAYYFKNKNIFINNTMEYLKNCNYSEYFVSGVYNTMIKNNLIVKNFNVDFHLAFGTPEEYEDAKNSSEFERLL